MENTAQIEIRTSDRAWAAKHGTPGREGRTIVTGHDVERSRSGRFVTFDLGSDLPADAGNRCYFAPVAWVVG